jgi:hypothetical protein
MRITISHKQPKAEVVQSVDQTFNELFKGVAKVPIQFVVKQKNWQGSTLHFSLSAKMGLLSTPIRGTIEVTETDLKIDADLGILERFIPAGAARAAIGNRIKALLK